MYKIAKLNKISPKGLELFPDNYEIVEDVNEANGILVRSQDMHEMNLSENLLAVARAGAGVNNIPLDKCSDKGIVVFNTPGANANAVKELVLCALLLGARNIPSALAWAKNLKEDVAKAVEKGKSQFAGNEIKGKTLGVIGLGAIGVMVANAATYLGMKVIGYDPYISLRSAHILSYEVDVADSLQDIIPRCDFISIHIPVMDSTKGMIDEKCIDMMKENCILLNFSRDKIVDEEALVKTLEKEGNRRYITDFPNETVMNCDKVITIPHLGASTAESEDNCAMMAVEQMTDYIENGNITNSVNFPGASLGAKTDDTRVTFMHSNVSTAIGEITGIMDKLGVKITNMVSTSKGDRAYTMLDIDGRVKAEDIKNMMSDDIISVRVLD